MLTVEDGTGIANADALVSLATWMDYAVSRGWAWSTHGDTDIESGIRRGSRFVSDHFTWQGLPVHGRGQAFQWPRYGVVDRNGWHVGSDTIPREIVSAVCEAAWQEIQTPHSLSPVVTMTDRIKSERIGPIAVEYASVPSSAGASRPTLTILHDIVKGLLKSSGSMSGRAVRA